MNDRYVLELTFNGAIIRDTYTDSDRKLIFSISFRLLSEQQKTEKIKKLQILCDKLNKENQFSKQQVNDAIIALEQAQSKHYEVFCAWHTYNIED